MPNRFDTSITAAIELDMALGSADRKYHDDDNMSIGSQSVATAVTANISQVTPDDELAVEESRGRRSRSDSSGRARHRRLGRTNTSRRTSPDSRKLVMCGVVGLSLDDETRWFLRDIKDSVKQIVSTVRRFGPEERNAVRETLLEAGNSVSNKVRATLLPGCGRDDGTGDIDVSPVQDLESNDSTQMRRDRANRLTSRRGRESSPEDGRRGASQDARRWKEARRKRCTDAVVDGGEEVVYSSTIVNTHQTKENVGELSEMAVRSCEKVAHKLSVVDSFEVVHKLPVADADDVDRFDRVKMFRLMDRER